MTCPSERRVRGLALLTVPLLLLGATPAPGPGQVAGTGGEDDPFAASSLFDRESPGAVTLGALAIEARRPIPLVAYGEHLEAGSLAGRGELAFAGRTVAVAHDDPLRLGIPAVARPYDRVVIRLEGPVRPGDRLRGVRLGRRLPSGHRVVHALALLEVVSAEAGSAVAVVRRIFGAFGAGHPVVRVEPFATRSAALQPVAEGRLVGVLGAERDQPILGLDDRLFLDAGSAWGVGPGDEFELLGPEALRGADPGPDDRLGTVRVVRADRRTSTARIVELRAGGVAGARWARHVRRPAGADR